MVDTERIKLPSGGWVEIKKWLSRGDRKQLYRLERQWMKMPDTITAAEIAANLNEAVVIDASKVDPFAIDDLIMELAIVAWSFAFPVTSEAIDALDDRDTTAILARMREHYLTAAEKEVLDLKKD